MKVKHKKLYRFLIIFCSIVLGIVCFFLIINIIPPKKVVKTNPFITSLNRPMIAAHRGGSDTSPENTLRAFKDSIANYNVDVVETDLWMTKDNVLVLNHDGVLNRTTDVEIRDGVTREVTISEKTFIELQSYNYGYNFEAKQAATGTPQIYPVGSKPFRSLSDIPSESARKLAINEAEVGILSIDNLFRYFTVTQPKPDLLYIVEIKDDGKTGEDAADILNKLLTETYPSLQNKVVIGTFNPNVEKYMSKNYPDLFFGASTSGALKYVVTQLLKVNIFDTGTFKCLQIPTSYANPVSALNFLLGEQVKLDTQDYIDRAHRRNIAVQYWTINDEETMKKLIKMGVDCIMTDRPDILVKVLRDLGKLS